jgi:hypothetical protein
VDADIATGILRRTPLDLAMWRKAVDLAREHTAAAGCRSLDILHVAAALTLNADLFYTFDQRQHALARRAGLRVLP